jgi:sugar lactone lactonase YvrE
MWTFSRAVLAALVVLIFTPIFVSPSLAQVITAGDILVADLGTGTIRRYSASGAEAAPFASGLSAPWSITADQLGNIYVSERDGQRVTKFSPAGLNLLTITTGFIPGGVRVGTDGMIYVVDSSGGKINRYSAAGILDPLFAPTTALVSADFMTFDAQGNLYVTGADSGNVNNEVVRRFSPAGADDFVAGFFGPAGIAFDTQGNLYVASSTSHFVEQYSSSGTDLGTFALGDPAGSDAFRGIAFDASGNLYVANSAGRNILRFPPAGGTAPESFASGLGVPWDLVIVTMPANPTVKPECKEDGWQSFDFRNQGDCIQFVNTGK